MSREVLRLLRRRIDEGETRKVSSALAALRKEGLEFCVRCRVWHGEVVHGSATD